MKFFRKNTLFAAFFVLILGPTVILSVFSFRNVYNEMFLAQKTFEEHSSSFKKDINTAVERERNKIFGEVKNASLFLYEQPKDFLEFAKDAPYKEVPGVHSILLFNGDSLIYPHFSTFFSKKNISFSTLFVTPVEQGLFNIESTDLKRAATFRSFRLMRGAFDSRENQTANLLGLLRYSYKEENFDDALRLLDILEKNRYESGYLQQSLIAPIRLLRFEILVKKNDRRNAEKLCLTSIKSFLSGEYFGDIHSVKFTFTAMLDQVLSFEDLKESVREEFWNLRENFSREIQNSEFYAKSANVIEKLLYDEESAKDGLVLENRENVIFFRMSYPFLSGNQVVIGTLEPKIIEKRLSKSIQDAAKNWNDVPYVLSNGIDSVLAENTSGEGQLAEVNEISQGIRLKLSIYKKSEDALAKESTHKIILMSALIVFSLLTVIVGLFFIFRSLHQERSLLAMKANFLSSISHELKTPLTSIKMFAEMMAKGRVKNIERIPEYANMICKETVRLENLIGAILNYTRMENGRSAFQWERLNLATAAEKVYESVEQIALNRGLSIDKRFEADSFITGDYTAVYSMIQNLIENAIKYTNPPGTIHVRVYNEGYFAIFEVEDTGVGIALSEQKNIFNDFYRVGDEMTRSTKGSGLGLAIVKRAADAHKATIALSSKPGQGSTFSVKFRKAE